MAIYTIFNAGRTDYPSFSNTFTIDGSAPHRVLGNMFTFFKVDSGNHTIVITSSNGQRWEISAYVGSSDCLNIRVQVDRNSHIVGVDHKVAPEPPTAWMFTKKSPK